MKFIPSVLTSLLCLSSFSKAATFVEPSIDGKILVSVDQLPLDTDTMKWLSNFLVELAAKQTNKSPQELQSAAKLIVLSHQLYPTNTKVKDTSELLSNNRPWKNPHNAEKEKRRLKRFYTIFRFLNKNDNTASRAFVGLTHDALSGIPAFEDRHQLSTKNPWKESVALIEEFEKEPEIVLTNSNRITHSELESNTLPSVSYDDPNLAQWHKKTQKIEALATLTSRNQSNVNLYHYGIQTLEINIQPKDGKQYIILKSQPRHERTDHFSHQASKIATPLKKLWSPFRSANVTVDFQKSYIQDNAHDQTGAAVTVALDCSLNNKTVRKNLVVATAIDSSGSFKRDHAFWNQITELVKFADNKRILVAKESEGDFRQILAYGKAEFFVKNEVIAVKNITESRQFSSTEDSKSIAQASRIFAEVQVALKDKPVGSMVANKHVRERLLQIIDANPNHLSAKMLLYLSNNKAIKLERKYAAFEIQKILKPLSYFQNTGNYLSIRPNRCENIARGINKKCDDLKTLLDRKDKDLLETVYDLTDEMNDLSKHRNKTYDSDGYISSYHSKAAKASLAKIKSDYKSLQTKLTKETGH